jgi:transposase InsO family protein
VNTHYNARLTVWGRGEAVRRVLLDQEPVALVAAALHVSPRTIHKWVGRYLAEGPAGLVDRSSRPHRSPHQTPPALVRRMVRLREQRLTGPEIAERLRLAPSTVGRVLQRLGLGRLRQATPRAGPRYERAHPGELLHVDLKGLPRFRSAGHRIHGERAKGGRPRGLGQDYLHVAIDDCTRLAFAELLPGQDGPTCAAFLTRAGAWFTALGIPIQRVMTDNAFAYRSRVVQAVLGRWDARHLRTRPYRPQTNGKAERFIQTCLRRWAYKRPYRTSAARGRALPAFLDSYNLSRPHRALGNVPPLFAFLMRKEQPHEI